MIIAAALAVVLQAQPADPPTTKEAMRRLQLIVGEWRATGQPKDPKREA